MWGGSRWGLHFQCGDQCDPGGVGRFQCGEYPGGVWVYNVNPYDPGGVFFFIVGMVQVGGGFSLRV